MASLGAQDTDRSLGKFTDALQAGEGSRDAAVPGAGALDSFGGSAVESDPPLLTEASFAPNPVFVFAAKAVSRGGKSPALSQAHLGATTPAHGTYHMPPRARPKTNVALA